MLRKIDRVLLRVPNLQSAVHYYQSVLGLKLLREEKGRAGFALGDGELVLHDDPELPAEAIYYLVDDVRALYRRRDELRMQFASAPQAVSRGYRATVRDPFGNVLLILDRSAEMGGGIEDGAPAGALFAGVEARVAPRREELLAIYEAVGRTADDLPYTAEFERLYERYVAGHDEPKPTRGEVWRHLLNLRKGGKLPKVGEARSRPPEVDESVRSQLRSMLAADMGKRDRLPYTPRFEQMVDELNRGRAKRLSPHHVWRLVATLAK